MKVKKIPIDKKTKIVLLEVLKNGFANEIEVMFLQQKFHVIKTERCYRCPRDFSRSMKDFDRLRDMKAKNYGYSRQIVTIDRETKIILLKVLKQGFATNEQRAYLNPKFEVCIIYFSWLCDECPYDEVGYTIKDYENEQTPKSPYE
jgi:hypothetical protein